MTGRPKGAAPGLADCRQASDGERVLLLCGDYDPPSLDHLRAIEAAGSSGRFDAVWVLPTPPGGRDRVGDMCSLFCADLATSGVRATLCRAALDKGLGPAEALAWCRRKFPTLRFSLGCMADRPSPGADVVFRMASQRLGENAPKIVVSLDKYVPAGDIVGRIREGRDESARLTPGVWAYIQGRRAYR